MMLQLHRFLRQLFINLAVLQSVSLVGCGDEAGSPNILSTQTEEYILIQRQTILTLTNETRTAVGVAALTLDPALTEVAQAHAVDMAVRGFFDHTNPDGESPLDRMRNAGISFRLVGENIAWFPSAESVVNGWINSPCHYNNMVNPHFGRVGIGVYKTDPDSEGNFYYVQLFAD